MIDMLEMEKVEVVVLVMLLDVRVEAYRDPPEDRTTLRPPPTGSQHTGGGNQFTRLCQ